MELQIPQSFKVQWLNTTLKFIKDDTQLVKDYPQMPSSHVEYLHNLIWHRKNDVGLGFKSLYSPVWEAMKIYSIKYKFKIVVEKSEDGMSGHLVMEKIPKTGEPAKKVNDDKEKADNKNNDEKKDIKNNDEKKDIKNNDEKKDIKNNDEKKDKRNNDEKRESDDETIQSYEIPISSQTVEVKCKEPEAQRSKKTKTKTKKPIPQMSRGLKMFMENQEILDSLSPLFIKTTLRSILDFITDELSASKIFTNLAPIESRFLMNFLSIYKKRNDLDALLSPACNEILTEISNFFEDFSKTCCLDISTIGVNSNTNKREVKYTKVPVFPNKKKSKLKENSIQTKTTKTISPNNTTKLANVHSISKEENITLKENSIQTKPTPISPNNNTKLVNVHSISKEENIILKANLIQTKPTPICPNKKTNKVTVPSISKEENITLKENSIQTKSTPISPNNKPKLANVHSISKEENNTLQKNVSKKTKKSKSINKTNILQNNTVSKDRDANSEPIDKVIKTIDNNVIKALSPFVKKDDDVKQKTSTNMKETSLNKSVLLPNKSISFTKEGTSSTAHTSSIRVDQKSPRMSILRDMTVPINSEKAVKMMQLMGWKGGALGPRGCGITEPIIPIPNFNARGLGHVSDKKSDKESKGTIEHIRSEIVNKILKMIDNDIKTCVIKLQNQLHKREIRFWKITLEAINKRMNLDAAIERRLEIKEKMIRNMDIIFNIDIEDLKRKIVITKKSKTEMETVHQNTKRKTNSEEVDINSIMFKTVVLKSILSLIKSEDNEIVIQFSEKLKAENIITLGIMIELLNERKYFQQKNCPVVAELGSKILEVIGDILLSDVIHESERYIVIQKKHPRSSVKETKTIVNKAESDENTSVFDNVRGPIKNKKKAKLLNALYKYEMENTEEFKENQWYNTADRSLLDTEQISKVINTQKEIHKNYKNITITIQNDQNNNRGVSAN